jgi:ethanolamine utilization microcompartment shell protein EutL
MERPENLELFFVNQQIRSDRLFGPVLPARMVHEVARIALAPQGLMVKHVDPVEVRIAVATVLAAAADVVLVAYRTPPPRTRCPSGYLTAS